MIWAILGVLAILSVLVIAHEAGHFITARRAGIAVREFGVGFPPRLYGRKKGNTIYSVNALPIGGFVSIKGEDGKEKGKDSFATKSAWVKTKVLLAGVTINFIIAYVIIAGLLAFGVANSFPFSLPFSSWQTAASKRPPNIRVVNVSSGSAADQAGVKTGDTIQSINGLAINSEDSLHNQTKANAGKAIQLALEHNGKLDTKQVTLGTSAEKGYLGVVTIEESKVQYRWWAVPVAAFVVCIQLVWATLAAFGNLISQLITHATVPETVAGPIGITAALPRVSAFGVQYILLLIAQISLSLAVVNSLPIGPLDGAKVLIIWLKRLGLKITARAETYIQFAGLAVLIGLILAVTLHDIVQL